MFHIKILFTGFSSKEDISNYGGYYIRIVAKHVTILTSSSINISTGDVITPSVIEYDLVVYLMKI